jgi:CTP synthase
MKRKIGLFCNVSPDHVITAQDVRSVYEVPLALGREGLDAIILKLLDLPYRDKEIKDWEDLVDRIRNPRNEVTIGLVGKYVGYEDSYKSLNEALIHGGVANDARVNIQWIEAEEMENGHLEETLAQVDGILVPGGFGIRGVAGMVSAIRYAREKMVPFFGICLGMQTATIEFARNMAGIADADSSEFNPDTPNRVIYKLRDLIGVEEMGGTMRLGKYECQLAPHSFAAQAYGQRLISERHRHRYEFNKDFAAQLTAAGLKISGTTPDGKFVEIIEIEDHPWFLACQFHPEFKSKPLSPHPLFRKFIEASLNNRLAGRMQTRTAGKAGVEAGRKAGQAVRDGR